MKPIQLFSGGVKGISPNLTAQRRLNCYFEAVGSGENQKIAIRGTPGLTPFVTLPTFPIRGMVEAGQFLYVVAGNVVYQVSQNGGYVKLGIIGLANSVAPVSMAINTTQVIIVDGIGGYVFDYALIQASSTTSTAALIANASVLTQLCNLGGNP